MAVVEFSLANNVTVDLGDPVVPLVAGEERILWESAEITGGAGNNSATMVVKYEAFDPDTSVVSPFSFELAAVLVQKQADNSWVEVARQNTPIRKLEQGPQREIILSPVPTFQDEGIDQVVAGFQGVPLRLRSRFIDSAEGTLKLCLAVVDYSPEGANPFVSVTFSAHGKKYDA